MRIELELSKGEAVALLHAVELLYEDDPLFSCRYDAVIQVERLLRKLVMACGAADAASGVL